MLGPTDLILIAIRWLHALAGAAWVGGGLFYLLVLRPSLAAVEDELPFESFKASLAKEFKEVVELCIMGLAITGVILAIQRLTQGGVSGLYVAILALKVAAAMAMFLVVRPGRRSKARFARKGESPQTGGVVDASPARSRWMLSPSQIVLLLGIVVFFLASMLQVVFEKAG